MKNYFATSIAAVFVALLASPASGSTFDFDCDSMTDHTSTVTFHVVGEQTVVRGEIELKDYRKNPKRTQPGVGLWIANSDDSKSVGFQLIDQSGKRRTLAAAFNSFDGRGTRRPLGNIDPSQPIPFELIFTTGGRATLKLGQLSESITVPSFRPARVNAFCVSSQFKFTGVELSDSKD